MLREMWKMILTINTYSSVTSNKIGSNLCLNLNIPLIRQKEIMVKICIDSLQRIRKIILQVLV